MYDESQIKVFVNKFYSYITLNVVLSAFCIALNSVVLGQNYQKQDSLKIDTLCGYEEFRGDIDTLNLPDFIDGPHYFWVDSSRFNVWYIEHNQEANSMQVRTKEYKIKKKSMEIRGLSPDKNRYHILKNNIPEPHEFKNVKKILTIGDVHGEYDTLVKMLRSAGVIDKKNDWIWEKGHLVFVGDVLDRGSKVTECLWLIRKLSQQAKIYGGRVHYILGNHEIMVLMKDTRYVAPKYKNMCKRLLINYYFFYLNNTELGRWLRNRNSVVKINDIIFVHGGLSNEVINKQLSISKINRDIRYCLNFTDEVPQETLKQIIFYPENPIWFRGYLMSTKAYDRINIEELDDVLKYFDASKIIFGHTEVDFIQSFYNKKTWAIDVPLYMPGIKKQMLFIEDNKFYRVYLNGDKELLE